jgi:hypothetical protein
MNETLLHKTLHKAALALIAAGIGLHLATALFFGNGNVGFRAGLCAWSITPYLLLALMRRRKIKGIGVFLGALAALLIDASAFWAVFVAPQHSTAALHLLAARS